MHDSFEEITITSTLDGSPEPSLLYKPANARVLLVGLHTWSADRFNQTKTMLPYCEERGWALLLPEFRGPNLSENPRATQAGGSAVARRDIADAAEWVIRERFQTRPTTFLLGGSGGGHMALMVASRESFVWDAVSSWCPITDLAAWHGEHAGYASHIASVCGGVKGASAAIDGEYHERSPLSYAGALRDVRLQLAHGRHDAVVSYTHSWRLAQELVASEQFYFSIFDGAHELRLPEAFAFFDRTLKRNAATELTG